MGAEAKNYLQKHSIPQIFEVIKNFLILFLKI